MSLEGLPEHNDWVRGAGHFERTTSFLRDLKELGVSSMVMLTLTEQNIDQVLPLAALLRGLVDDFHFNRLAMVGEGANLRLPSRERYARFLAEYLEAAERDPALGIKDNLINILRRERGAPPFGGCTGFGCGAAFNFIALLPDGEAHACRKFPSPIGNAVRDGIAAVYDSAAARAYRARLLRLPRLRDPPGLRRLPRRRARLRPRPAARARPALLPHARAAVTSAATGGLSIFRTSGAAWKLTSRRPAAIIRPTL